MQQQQHNDNKYNPLSCISKTLNMNKTAHPRQNKPKQIEIFLSRTDYAINCTQYKKSMANKHNSFHPYTKLMVLDESN